MATSCDQWSVCNLSFTKTRLVQQWLDRGLIEVLSSLWCATASGEQTPECPCRLRSVAVWTTACCTLAIRASSAAAVSKVAVDTEEKVCAVPNGKASASDTLSAAAGPRAVVALSYANLGGRAWPVAVKVTKWTICPSGGQDEQAKKAIIVRVRAHRPARLVRSVL